jgi:uncharacterized RDD family membrane protein YckC
MFCSKCGANVAEGAAFCNACGAPVASVGIAQAAAPPAAPPVYVASAVVALTTPYAGFWLRFVAFIIDAIVLGFAGAVLTLPFGAGFGLHGLLRGRAFGSPEDLVGATGLLFKVIIIRAILHWLYFALLESSEWRGTLGKKALGLEVTDLNGNRIDFARASGRFFAKILSTLILFIGYMMAGFTEKKQALHDILAGCLVIRKV